jgi:DNA repair exonuclease SbcCD ATPase subunit
MTTQLQTIIDQVTACMGDVDAQLETETTNLSNLEQQLRGLAIREDSKANMTADLANQSDLKQQIADSKAYVKVLQDRRAGLAQQTTRELDLKNAVRDGVANDLKAALAAPDVAEKMTTAQGAMTQAAQALGDWLAALDTINSGIKADGKAIDKLVAAGGQVFANQFVTSWIQTGFIARAKADVDSAVKHVTDAYGKITA